MGTVSVRFDRIAPHGFASSDNFTASYLQPETYLIDELPV